MEEIDKMSLKKIVLILLILLALFPWYSNAFYPGYGIKREIEMKKLESTGKKVTQLDQFDVTV